MSSINITIHPEDASQVEAIKAFMIALKIRFEVSNNQQYDPEFVNMVLKAEQEIRQGKGLKVTSDGFDDLWK